jgi:hypothetical protein
MESNLEDGDEGEKNKKHKYKQGKNDGNVEDQQPAPEVEVAKVSDCYSKNSSF